MSTKKKSKKLRRPNVAGAVAVQARGGGVETAAEPRGPRATGFDYTYVIRDLKRIGVLAGSFIAILVILSFIIK
jgi:hypothetical protein